MNVWFAIGLVLIIWAMVDLITGKVWLHRAYLRSEEPVAFWTTWSVWFVVAVVVTLGSL